MAIEQAHPDDPNWREGVAGVATSFVSYWILSMFMTAGWAIVLGAVLGTIMAWIVWRERLKRGVS